MSEKTEKSEAEEKISPMEQDQRRFDRIVKKFEDVPFHNPYDPDDPDSGISEVVGDEGGGGISAGGQPGATSGKSDEVP